MHFKRKGSIKNLLILIGRYAFAFSVILMLGIVLGHCISTARAESTIPNYIKPIPIKKNPFREHQECKYAFQCENTVITLISRAKESILTYGYDFSHPRVLQATIDLLVDNPEAEVFVLLDNKSFSKRLVTTDLLRHGANVKIDNAHAGRLKPTIIIDSFEVIIFHDQYIEIQHNPTIAQIYSMQWLSHAKHSLELRKTR